MTERDDIGGNIGRRVLWMMLAALGIFMSGGAIAGFLTKMTSQDDDPLNPAGMISLAIFIAIIGSLASASGVMHRR